MKLRLAMGGDVTGLRRLFEPARRSRSARELPYEAPKRGASELARLASHLGVESSSLEFFEFLQSVELEHVASADDLERQIRNTIQGAVSIASAGNIARALLRIVASSKHPNSATTTGYVRKTLIEELKRQELDQNAISRLESLEGLRYPKQRLPPRLRNLDEEGLDDFEFVFSSIHHRSYSPARDPGAVRFEDVSELASLIADRDSPLAQCIFISALPVKSWGESLKDALTESFNDLGIASRSYEIAPEASAQVASLSKQLMQTASEEILVIHLLGCSRSREVKQLLVEIGRTHFRRIVIIGHCSSDTSWPILMGSLISMFWRSSGLAFNSQRLVCSFQRRFLAGATRSPLFTKLPNAGILTSALSARLFGGCTQPPRRTHLFPSVRSGSSRSQHLTHLCTPTSSQLKARAWRIDFSRSHPHGLVGQVS